MKVNVAVKCVLCVWDKLKSSKRSISVLEISHLSNPGFQLLLERIKNTCNEMNPDELTICFLYLNKCGLSMQDKTMQNLLNNCMKIMKDGKFCEFENIYLTAYFLVDDAEFSLTALSRFTVTVNASKQLYTYFICQDAYKKILKYLDVVQTAEELRLVTICLNSLHQLITIDILNDYKNKVTQLYEMQSITADKTKCLLKIIQFLNYPHWSQDNTELLRTLVLMLSEKIETFQMRELEQIFKVFKSKR